MSDENSEKDKDLLHKVGSWKSLSENLISTYHDAWVENIRQVKGIFPDDENIRSNVRNRSKIFFRKTWASRWRILASFYNAFLKDVDNFKIEGRDTLEDPQKAELLQKMVEYRRDVMLRSQSLFKKFLWAFMNIFDMGWCVGKWRWVYNDEQGKDYPEFILYPNEQVYPDLMADTKEDMRFIIFENYMTKDRMEELGYKNIENAQKESMPTNIVRQTRFYGEPDPLQNPGENEYPKAGRYIGEDRKQLAGDIIYKVWEIFYKENGKIMFVATNALNCVLKDPEVSPFGDRYPVTMGDCLTEANKLIGEGFPAPLKGPQDSLNMNLNQRKDNVALVLNRQTIVSRYGNVDLESLVNSRPGGITLADDPAAVVDRQMQDVTQSSYLEAAADETMMNEMSGVTPGKMGMGKEQKATVAQINYSESNAKIDLFIAIVSETFMRDFYTQLAYMIQRFETDEKIFAIANAGIGNRIFEYNIDFEADCIMNVGSGTAGRELEINQLLMAMDRSTMSNQSAIALLQTGMVPQNTQIKLIDTTQFMADILPKIGRKDFQRYIINFQAQPPPEQGGQNAALAGRLQPQIGEMGNLPDGI